MAKIEYYFSTISPYTYLAGPRLRAIVESHGAEIVVKPFDIIGLFPRTGGLPLPERHPSRQAYRLVDLERQAKKAGMPLNVKPAHFPTNPAPSSYAIIAAQAAGGGDVLGLVERLLAACWAEEKDIAQDDVIKECLGAAGFDPALADTGLFTGAEAYGRNLEEAVAAGVFGAPTWIVDGGEMFWGQDRIEDLDLFLKGAL
ncbi:2-hydroxychromene-2-carboxylate isomerase [Maritimibacter sp. UBA3975]|uniref:2-hydroxychromene-2-carboxylate isomerase n=1 Tax=Maritimibacter sp. UBA3975 TaxID=1946833 RepID=UPI000C097D18|nr:2-hydroxychromene-2-carboxylate isomerase [Maritimibacter sp. UBA3975]MAM63015.1 2-hydroxychromene-2-carboxylate isomerase [Maritimibacter sp.]|tara:strand:+ start:54240 stop:54839 length:600 start_codon:yes stop_codon:yes gene_type:complete